ncbi:cupredoxin domain-containing protein [Halomicrococcus sp. SG-WS-1]|uniref:cupredoxin domain-containing protein n=1 Tax=Halomicrococcus sp. SG-WS-1 TaxID=3439057 RepID=UPI003F797DD8
MNLDGVEHELIIEDADGKALVESDSATEQGATVSVTFTADEAMAEYYCEYHPQDMRGDVELGTGFEHRRRTRQTRRPLRKTAGATTTPDGGDDRDTSRSRPLDVAAVLKGETASPPWTTAS